MKRFKKWSQKHGNPAISQRIKTKITEVLDDSEEEEIICYKWNKPSHIKPDCPLNRLDNGKKKQRVFTATWDDREGEEENSDSDKEQADLCYMAHSDDSGDDEPSEVLKLWHSDLLFLYHEINGGYERLKQRYNKLELEKNSLIKLTIKLEKTIEIMKMVSSRDEKYQSLEDEIDKSNAKIETLEKENVILKNSKTKIIWRNHEFEKVIEKFKDFERWEFEKYRLLNQRWLRLRPK